MSKCDGLAQGIGFSAPNSCSLPCVVKSTTRLCTSKKEYNKLERTASQCFSLVDHNDWSRWFAISSPHVYAVSVTVLLVVLQKKHRHLISLSRVTYRAPVEMLLVHSRQLKQIYIIKSRNPMGLEKTYSGLHTQSSSVEH